MNPNYDEKVALHISLPANKSNNKDKFKRDTNMSSPRPKLRLQMVIVGLIILTTTLLINNRQKFTVLSAQRFAEQQQQQQQQYKQARQLQQQQQQQGNLSDQLALSSAACRGINFVSRKEWAAKEALPSNNFIQKFPRTPDKVFIHQAWDGRTCNDIDSCKIRLQAIQAYHQFSKGWPDISYNFLISGDGSIFEGLGFRNIGFHTLNYNHNSFGIAFIGTFHNILPTKKMELALESLLNCTLHSGYLSAAYTLHGHRDARCTICPGDAAYSRISTMARFKAGPLSQYSCPLSSNSPPAVLDQATSINSDLLIQQQQQQQQQSAAQFRGDGQNMVDEPQAWQSIHEQQPIRQTNLSYEDTQSLLDYLFQHGHEWRQQQHQQKQVEAAIATNSYTGDAPAKLVKHKQTPEEPRAVVKNKIDQALEGASSSQELQLQQEQNENFHTHRDGIPVNKSWYKNEYKSKNQNELQIENHNRNQNQFQNALIMRDREPQKVVNINSHNKLISLALHANSHSNANWNLNSLQSPSKLAYQSSANSLFNSNNNNNDNSNQQQQQQTQQHQRQPPPPPPDLVHQKQQVAHQVDDSSPSSSFSSLTTTSFAGFGGKNVAREKTSSPLFEETYVGVMRRRQGGLGGGGEESDSGRGSNLASISGSLSDDFPFRTKVSDSDPTSHLDKPAETMFKSAINKHDNKLVVINMPSSQQPVLPVGGATIAPSFYLLTGGVKPGTIGIIAGGGSAGGGGGGAGGSAARPAGGGAGGASAGGGAAGGATRPGGAGAGAGSGVAGGGARPGGAGVGVAGGAGTGGGGARPGGAGAGLGGAGAAAGGAGGGQRPAGAGPATGAGGATSGARPMGAGGMASASGFRPTGSGTLGVFSATSEQMSGASPPRSTIGSFLDQILALTSLGNITIF